MKVIRRSSGILEKIKRAVREAEFAASYVAVGFPKGKSKQTEIQKAIWNEFGTKARSYKGDADSGFDPTNMIASGGIPERPFMRNTMRNNKAKYGDGFKKSAPKVLRGDVSVKATLNKMGALVQGDIQSEITALMSPPNSPETIKKKGSSNPLIDSGRMRQSVTWELRK